MYVARNLLCACIVNLAFILAPISGFGTDLKYGYSYNELMACINLNTWLTHKELDSDIERNFEVARRFIDSPPPENEDKSYVESIHRAIDEWAYLEEHIDDCDDMAVYNSVAFFAQSLHLYPWSVKSRIDKVIGPSIAKFLDNCATPKHFEELMDNIFADFELLPNLEVALTPEFMVEFTKIRRYNKPGVLELLKDKFKELAAKLYEQDYGVQMSMTELDLMKHLLKEKDRINAFYITRPCDQLRSLVQNDRFPILASLAVLRESLYGNLMESVSDNFKRKLTFMRVCNDLLSTGGSIPWHKALSDYYERNQPDTL